MKKSFVLLALCSLLLTCGLLEGKRESVAERARVGSAPGAPAAPPSSLSDLQTAKPQEEAGKAVTFIAQGEKVPAKIIKTADIRFQVSDYAKSRAEITRIVEVQGGYIASEQENREGEELRNQMVIRVRSEAFEKLVAALLAESAFTHYRNISARDVTEEYVDVQTRLKTKKEVEQRYLEILRQAHTIPDILSVERELRTIREEIEATEGKLRYLSDQVDYSTINLSIYQKVESQSAPDPTSGFFRMCQKALDGGWAGLKLLCIGLLYIWPLDLFVLAVIFLIWRIVKKRKALR